MNNVLNNAKNVTPAWLSRVSSVKKDSKRIIINGQYKKCSLCLSVTIG